MNAVCQVAAATLLASVAVGTGWSQVMMNSRTGGQVRLLTSDAAILDTRDARQDLPCAVEPIKPVLGFDLRFHTGYQVKLPLRELAGRDNLLTIIFRVYSNAQKDEPAYFLHRFQVPEVAEDAHGDVHLEGGFDIGEGVYQVEWLMRDRLERICSNFWDLTAELPSKDRDLTLAIRQDHIEQTSTEYFKEEPPVRRAQYDQPLNVKVLINFAPQKRFSSALQAHDKAALVSILRNIVRQPELGKFSVVAFNMEEQRVLFRQEDVDRVDFPSLGESVENLTLGTVSLNQLSQKNSEAEFLAGLIRSELGAEMRSDAIIFAGPKALLESKVPEEALQSVGTIEFPIFYMNYNLYPNLVPWRDAIGNAVKFFKGVEYTISRPRDLWFAVNEMVSQIVKSREVRRALASSSH
jgi:hypothetical protein